VLGAIAAIPEQEQIDSIERIPPHVGVSALGLPPAQILASGAGFAISMPLVSREIREPLRYCVLRGDDWLVRNNLTLNLGLRYENQPNISTRALSTGVAVAGRRRRANIHFQDRAGAAASEFFTDRFRLLLATAKSYNGMVQQQ